MVGGYYIISCIASLDKVTLARFEKKKISIESIEVSSEDLSIMVSLTMFSKPDNY